MMEAKPKRKYVRKDTRKYWYYYYERECVLCGDYELTKERRYGPKPADYADRWERVEYACESHFM
jgi:hypothetical protein